ncbi:hypothetical protein JT358_11130 [Micrococcales bacterium 31B]|nr:hypothetical protein [Micrococcales bacterium 31B]
MSSVNRATSRRHRATRVIAGLGLALCAVSLTAACSRVSPVQTSAFYQPSDGAVVNLGTSADVRNLLILTDTEQTVAQVDGVLVNNTDAPLTVTLTGGDNSFSADVEVPAGKSVRIGPGQEQQITVDPATAAPGSVVYTAITSGTEKADNVPVPVLDGTQEEYKAPIELMKQSAGS